MKKTLLKIVLAIILATTANLLMAQAVDFEPSYIPQPDNLPGPSVKDQANKGTQTILATGTLPKYAVGMVGFIGALTLLFLIIAGVRFLVAYGNEDSITKAKEQVIYALVGFVVAILAYTLVTAIVNFDFTKK